MKFDTIQDALRWYFNRAWIRPPADARSMQPVKISTSPRMENTEAVIATSLRIERILDQLPGRDWAILRGEFHRKGQSQADLAMAFNLAGGDRSVRYIRDKLIEILEPEMRQAGVLAEIKYSEPVRAQQ